jgi:hypothetical protein
MSLLEILFNEKSQILVKTRVCRSCKKEKPLTKEFFHKNCSSENGFRYECKECRKPGAAKDPKAARRLRKKFNIKTPPLGTPCACCGKTDQMLVCDHIHGTETIRGFICDNCNVGIGRLGDSIEGVKKALNYLEGNYLT